MGFFKWAADQPLDIVIAAAQAAASDDTPAMGVILERFEPLVCVVARSLTSDWSLQEDAAQGARLGLVQAVRRHRIGTPGFAAYAKRYMSGSALRHLKAMQSCESSVDPLVFPWADNAPPLNVAPDTTVEVLDFINVLTAEQQAVTIAYYIDDLRLQDIAEVLNISKPAVSQRLKTIHCILRPVLETAVAA